MDNHFDDGECSTSAEDFGVGHIRRRRFSAAKIQPTRIKKVMQSDEEIGRMVASVPVAIGSAMEMFAERLLLSAAECVQFSTTKTLSPMHIKYAVCQNPQFSFLESLLKDVPLPKFTPDYHETRLQDDKPDLNFVGNASQSVAMLSTISSSSIEEKNFVMEKQKAILNNYKSQNNNTLINEKFEIPVKRKRGRPPKQKDPIKVEDNYNNPDLNDNKPDVMSQSIIPVRNSTTTTVMPSKTPTILG